MLDAADKFIQRIGHAAIIVSCGKLGNWTLHLARIHTQLRFAEGELILANGMIFFSSWNTERDAVHLHGQLLFHRFFASSHYLIELCRHYVVLLPTKSKMSWA